MTKIKFATILMLLGTLLFSQQSYCQTPYLNKTFLLNGNYNLINNIFPTDSGYIASFSYGNTICLLDSTANVKWLRDYSFLNMPAFLTKMIKTSNNEYIITGTCQDGTAQNNLIFAIKLDSSFDTIYSKVLLRDSISCNGCLHSNTLIETTDNNLLFAGGHNKDSNDVFTGSRNGLILKTDSEANIIRRNTIGPQNDDDGFATVTQMGNSIYLFGATRSYAPGYVTGFDRTDGWVVKTDLQGNEVASINFGNPALSDRDFTYGLKLPNNKIITGRDIGILKHASGFRMFQSWAIILNNDLSVYREFYFKNTYVNGDTIFNNNIEQAILLPDSSVSFLGRNSSVSISGMSSISSNAFVLKIDTNYKIKFYREYVHNGGNLSNINPQVITTTSDGGYIFGGYVVDNTLTPSQQAWLVKTDSLGCDGYTSCNDTAIVVEILSYPDTLCRNDTNLIHVRIKGRSAPYSLFANATLAMDSIYYPYTLPLWIDTLMPFIPQDTGWQQLVVALHEPWERRAYDSVQVYVKNCTTLTANHDYYKNMVDVFPNPATNVLHVNFKTALTLPATITVYDSQGNKIKQITTKKNENIIDISKLVQGVYGIRVSGNGASAADKFVKVE